MKTVYWFLIALIFVPSICVADTQVSCAYPELNTNEMVPEKSCGAVSSDGLLSINRALISKINWNKDGIECAYIYGTENINGWYIIKRSGSGRISPFWPDNSCEPFSYGLAVGLINGNVVFYNQDLEVVKRTNYSWASGFQKGYSKVCIGYLEKEYDSSGEHFEYKGGKCGYVDTNFKVIVPLNYSFEKTPKPKSP